MIKKKKILEEEHVPEFDISLSKMAVDSKIFVDKSLEIANYILQVLYDKNLKQKDLADSLGKSEAEISKWLTGMHNFTLRSLAKVEAALGTTIVSVSKRDAEVKMTMETKTPSVSTKIFDRPTKAPFLKVAYKEGSEIIQEDVELTNENAKAS